MACPIFSRQRVGVIPLSEKKIITMAKPKCPVYVVLPFKFFSQPYVYTICRKS